MASTAGSRLSGMHSAALDAEAHTKVVEAQAPEAADVYFLRALLAEHTGEQLRLLDRALALEPSHAEALLERINRYLVEEEDTGVLIGDRENEVISGKFSEKVSHYREWGTRFAYGTELTNLVDTVHFTHSHHSRMLQLADLHAWLRQLCAAGPMDKWHRREVLDHVQKLPDCMHANRYKHWPPEPK